MKKLITNEIREELKANHERSQQGMNRCDMVPVLRLFTPDAACTWVLVSGEEVNSDVMLYGWCDLGLGSPEYGYVSLRELESVRGRMGLPAERDASFQTSLTLRDYVEDTFESLTPDPYV